MNKCIIKFLLLLLIISCGNKDGKQYSISGNIGEKGEKLFLFGLDSRYEKFDSTTVDDEGNFSFTLSLDTITPLALVTPKGEIVTLYAEPGVEAILQKDDTIHCGYSASGGATQLLHDSISRLLDACKSNSERLARIDDFITKYPVSEVNIEIMRRYLIDTASPDNNQIRSRISKLGGILQDHEFFMSIKKSIDRKNSNTLHRLFPTFTYKTEKGKETTLGAYKDKYTLITFWASWDKQSVEGVKKLQAVADSVKSNSFGMLNIALDHNIDAWKHIVESDSIAGDNVCDTKAWDSELVNSFNIKSLPYSILLSPYQRIIMFDANLDRMGEHINSLATKFDKEQEEKEKKNKKKNKLKK